MLLNLDSLFYNINYIKRRMNPPRQYEFKKIGKRNDSATSENLKYDFN